jgi:hypothetical protein
MLTIRGAQFQVLVEERVRKVRAEIVGSLWGMRSEFSPGLQKEDLERLVSFSIDQCRLRGFKQKETVHDFALAMLKDDELPMTTVRMEQKALAVFHEIETRTLFAQVQAVEAGVLPPDPTREGEPSGSV